MGEHSQCDDCRRRSAWLMCILQRLGFPFHTVIFWNVSNRPFVLQMGIRYSSILCGLLVRCIYTHNPQPTVCDDLSSALSDVVLVSLWNILFTICTCRVVHMSCMQILVAICFYIHQCVLQVNRTTYIQRLRIYDIF